MKKILLIVAILLDFQACANAKTIENSTKQSKKENRMTNTDIFGEKPIYKLRIKANNVAIVAKINATEVYGNFSEGHAVGLVTVNDLISNENNTLSMMLFSETMGSNIQASVTLEVYAEGKHYILNTLNVDMRNKDKTAGSTKIGNYTYDHKKGLIPEEKGKIIIGDIRSEKFNIYRGDKDNVINFSQIFSLPTPYPRWKFLDSQDIIKQKHDYLSKEEDSTLQKSSIIQALYAIDAKIRKALKEKKPEKIIDLFEERFQEDSIALYAKPEDLKKELLDSFRVYVNDKDCTLLEDSKEEHYFVIEENKKLAWIKSIEFHNKKTGIYHSYTIQYRLNNKGEWVITR